MPKKRGRLRSADLDLRTGIVEALLRLKGDRTLEAVAEQLDVTTQMLSHYLSPPNGKQPTLGGDILFRICEAGMRISCRQKTLLLVDDPGQVQATEPEQLLFVFSGVADVRLPGRKLSLRVESVQQKKLA